MQDGGSCAQRGAEERDGTCKISTTARGLVPEVLFDMLRETPATDMQSTEAGLRTRARRCALAGKAVDARKGTLPRTMVKSTMAAREKRASHVMWREAGRCVALRPATAINQTQQELFAKYRLI